MLRKIVKEHQVGETRYLDINHIISLNMVSLVNDSVNDLFFQILHLSKA